MGWKPQVEREVTGGAGREEVTGRWVLVERSFPTIRIENISGLSVFQECPGVFRMENISGLSVFQDCPYSGGGGREVTGREVVVRR